eukprot:2043602-Prymnesium_polylepis.1
MGASAPPPPPPRMSRVLPRSAAGMRRALPRSAAGLRRAVGAASRLRGAGRAGRLELLPTAGNQLQRVLHGQRTRAKKRPAVPPFDIILSHLYRAKVWILLLGAAAMFVLAGLIEGALLVAFDCIGEKTLLDAMLRSMLHLFGADPPYETPFEGCVAVFVVAQATGLLLQVILVAMITVRLLN